MSQPIQLPPLVCPFPSALSPYTESVQADINQWMQDFGYLQSERAVKRFKAGKFAWTTGRAHPHAAYEPMLLVATYMSWLFMLDDLCDEAELGHQPDKLKQLHDDIIDHMHCLCATTDPVLKGLHDVWTRMLALATPDWTARFIEGFADYAAGCQWEARNRAGGIIPPLGEYIDRRRQTSALYIFFDLIELADHVVLPESVRNHPVLRHLKVLANDGVAWFNDIVSLEKEIKSGDVHNLVLVLQHHDTVSLQTAANRAGAMFNSLIVNFQALEAALPDFGAAHADVERYIAGLKYWVRGNIDWSFETGRYGQVAVVTT